MKKWKLGDRVVRREGGPMIGTIIKIGPNRGNRHTIANITVRWPNHTEGKVSPGQIRITLPYRLERFRDIFEGR